MQDPKFQNPYILIMKSHFDITLKYDGGQFLKNFKNLETITKKYLELM